MALHGCRCAWAGGSKGLSSLRNVAVCQQLHYLSIPMGKAQTCRTKVIDLNDGVSQYAWYPCTANFQYSHMAQTIFWLKAYFSTPMVAAAVLVHLVTDGTYYLDQKQETIGVQLFDTKEQSHDLGVHVLSCRNNPLIIPVIHDLSHPFYHTQAVLISFSSQFVAISGVALRSFHNFDPITVSSCQRGQTYSPAEQSCVHYSCEATDCQKLEIDNALLNCTGGGWYNGAQCNVSCRTGYILQVQRDDDLSKSQVFQARICGTCMQEMNYQSNSRICGLDSSYCVVLNCMVLLPQIFPSFGSSSDHKQLEMRWDTWLVISAHGTSCFSIKLVVLSLLSFSWVCVLVRLIGGTRAVFFLLK